MRYATFRIVTFIGIWPTLSIAIPGPQIGIGLKQGKNRDETGHEQANNRPKNGWVLWAGGIGFGRTTHCNYFLHC